MEMILDRSEVDGELLIESQEYDDVADNYADVQDTLTKLMKKNRSKKWYVEVHGFGWLNDSGYNRFHSEDGGDLLSKVLPNTDNSVRVYKYGKNGIAINNVHHDSPVWGKEWYYIVPDTKAIQKQFDEANRG